MKEHSKTERLSGHALEILNKYNVLGKKTSRSGQVIEMERQIQDLRRRLKGVPVEPAVFTVEQLSRMLRTVMVTEGVMLKREQVQQLIEKIDDLFEEPLKSERGGK